MKTNIISFFKKSLLINLLSVMVIGGCKKEAAADKNNGGADTNNIISNSFTYKGINYSTPICYYSPMYTAEGMTGGTYEIFLPTSGVSFEKVKRTNSFGTFYDSYPKGIGNAVKLRFTSTNKTDLPAGNYLYSFASTTPEVFGFISVYTGYDFTKSSGTRDRPSQSNKGNGQVLLSKSGGTTTIIYEFTFDTGEKVKGSFKGSLNSDWYSTFNNNW
jgi:hypothetical protein